MRCQATGRQYPFEQHSRIVILCQSRNPGYKWQSNFKSQKITLVTIQMRQIVYVAHDKFWAATESLQSQLEYTKSNVLVLAAVVLHECGRHKHMVPWSYVFACLFEHWPGRFDAFGTASKFHVLHIRLQDKFRENGPIRHNNVNLPMSDQRRAATKTCCTSDGLYRISFGPLQSQRTQSTAKRYDSAHRWWPDPECWRLHHQRLWPR